MAFWDFLKRLFGKPGPTAKKSVAEPATAPSVEADPSQPAAPAPVVPRTQPRSKAPTLPPEPPPAKPIDFLPISRSELLQGAEEVRRTTGWMFFGRRDIIPPVSDARTKLIDRGMVTQGFITPDALNEIHSVGEQYDQFANRERHIAIQAAKSAQEAVEADRAARVALKAQKKAEAAQRRQQRAAAVIARKATDIIFVGRGVSAQLRDRQSDDVRLQAAGLPILHNPNDLAAALGLSIPKLRWLCFHTEVATRIHYVQFEVPKKSGGTRTLSAPHKTLAVAQEWILANILAKLAVDAAAHGFVPGRSTLTNALPHAGKTLLVNLDLEGFFPSIGFARVRHRFRRLGYSGSVATLLALLCTECPRKKIVYAGTTYFVATGARGLPQGACTSPALSNQIARRLDRRLTGLAAKLGLTYTRYADDLTFSALSALNAKIGYLLARVRHIAQDEGFAVNKKKTRVQRANARQTVTGLVVNQRPGVPRKIVRRIRAILHRAKKEGLAAQNRHGVVNFRAWLDGMIAYISMVRPETGSKFRQALDVLGR